MTLPPSARRTLQACFAVAVFWVTACSDPGSPRPEGPGAIQVQLVSPNGSEGSAVFELEAEGGLGVVSAVGGEVYYEHNSGRGISRVVVIMDVPGEISFRVRTNDVGDVPAVTLLQVADGSDELRESVSGYDLEVTPLPDGGS